jgi:hypothetical protein
VITVVRNNINKLKEEEEEMMVLLINKTNRQERER